ncbi:hypothetical protein [Alkalithermobacter paradoxus]|uniref:Pilus assembly protein, PilO n=1 Tax=Alkalithermobacter paradoxus TaxID=29349 RepID=A0A1V4I8R0_9FIRM|nr:hypothetical protein CLOTH_07400 [[Clostridium] thermoalcaliphilum]
MIKLSKREKILLFILIILIILAAFYYLLFIPKYTKIKELRNELSQYEETINLLGDKQYDNLQESIADIDKKIYNQTQSLLPVIKQEKIIVILNEMLSKADLKGDIIEFSEVEDVNFDDEKKIVDIKKMVVNINYTGSYESLMNFIKQTQSYDKHIGIKSIRINKDNENYLVGRIGLELYSVSKLHNQDEEYLKWEYNNKYGKDNPFLD